MPRNRPAGLLRRVVVTATVFTAVAGLLSPAIGYAAPTPPPTPPAVGDPAAAATPPLPPAVEDREAAATPPPIPHMVADPAAVALPEATEEEKVQAIRTLGIDIDNSWLVLRDKDFVFKIFDNAKGPLVKDGALQAYRDGDAASTVFIRTGIYGLDKRDKDNYAREKIERDLARKLKQSAASLVAMPVTDQQLDLSYRDFIYEIWQFVRRLPAERALPKVKAAALDAFGGSDEQQKVFLDKGLLAAKRQDQQDAIDADNQATEAEKARLAARNAKANAASVVLLPVEDTLLNLSDDNFIRKVIEKAVQGSEVHAAAWTALNSSAPADWAAFIKTGIFDANKRDIAIALQKKADEDRRVARELKAKAENGRMQPRLVAAATAALAGSDQAVADFLKDGQFAVPTQSLEATTSGFLGWYVRSEGGDAGITPGDAGTNGTGVLTAATWKVVAGLADSNCFSLESSQFVGSYLRQNATAALLAANGGGGGPTYGVQLAANDGSTAFKNNATWCTRLGLTGSGVSLESKTSPGLFLRHTTNRRLWVDNGNNFKEDSTWRIVNPDPEISTPITLRWLNESSYNGWLGYPTAAEVYDAGVRYRDFGTNRAYWSQSTGVRYVWGPILTKYLSIGGHKVLLPTADSFGTRDKTGFYNHFVHVNGGDLSIYYSRDTNAHLLSGGIRHRWLELGAEKSDLGYPISDEFDIPGGRSNTFQRGWIDWDAATGKITVRIPRSVESPNAELAGS